MLRRFVALRKISSSKGKKDLPSLRHASCRQNAIQVIHALLAHVAERHRWSRFVPLLGRINPYQTLTCSGTMIVDCGATLLPKR
jgi:hypothetical protein